MRMRVYDHLIRVFPGLGAGDLRQGNVNVFGALQSRSELFVRQGASPLVTNHDGATVYKNGCVLDHFYVDSIFVRADDERAASEAYLAALLPKELRVAVLVGAGSGYHAVSPLFRSDYWMGWGSDKVDEPVRVQPGQAFSVIVTIGDELREHLNGLVQEDGKWKEADPRMLRIVKISMRLDTADADG